MRSLAVLIVLILAFYVLLADNKSGQGKGKASKTETKTESESESEFLMDSLSDEFKPQDLSQYSTIQKLNEDFDYRRAKLEYNLNEEVKAFVQSHDRYGDDREAYDKLVKHHANLRKEFYENRMKTLQYYQDTKSTERINSDLR